MIVENKNIVSAATLAAAAQLGTEVMMRLSQNGVSGTVAGQYITRTTEASGVLNVIRGNVLK